MGLKYEAVNTLNDTTVSKFKQTIVGRGVSVGGAWWLRGRFGPLRPEGRRFESHSIASK